MAESVSETLAPLYVLQITTPLFANLMVKANHKSHQEKHSRRSPVVGFQKTYSLPALPVQQSCAQPFTCSPPEGVYETTSTAVLCPAVHMHPTGGCVRDYQYSSLVPSRSHAPHRRVCTRLPVQQSCAQPFTCTPPEGVYETTSTAVLCPAVHMHPTGGCVRDYQYSSLVPSRSHAPHRRVCTRLPVQ